MVSQSIATTIRQAGALDGSSILIQPTVVAGDPNGVPPDSPDARIDPNTTTSPFAGVGSISVSSPNVGDFLGSGTPISRRHILTAAHLLDLENDDGLLDVAPENVAFNLNFGRILSHRITAASLQIFPGFQGFANTLENDLAIITLAEDLPEGVPIYDLYRQPLDAGAPITLVGYGTSGNGIDGFQLGTASFDQKRVGANVVDLSLDGVFIYDFDGPDASSNLFALVGSGTTLGNDVEATTGPGDSGGPSFIRVGDAYYLAGVNTFAFGFPEGFGLPGFIQGTFGTGAGGVVVSDPLKLSWIDSILATLPPLPDEGNAGGGGGTPDDGSSGGDSGSEPPGSGDGSTPGTGGGTPPGDPSDPGNDLPPTLISGTPGDDTLQGTVNADVMVGDRGDDVLVGLAGADVLNGGDGNDILRGGLGDDTLRGARGNDTLIGGDGDDRLIGGLGADVLTTGGGSDRIGLRAVQEGVDRILDFDPTADILDLRQLFNHTMYGNANPVAAYLQLVQVGANTVVRVDKNGDRAANGFVNLLILDNVTATDLGAAQIWA